MLLIKILALAFLVAAVPIPSPAGPDNNPAKLQRPRPLREPTVQGDNSLGGNTGKMSANAVKNRIIPPPQQQPNPPTPPPRTTSPMKNAWNKVTGFFGKVFGGNKKKGVTLFKPEKNRDPLDAKPVHDMFKPDRDPGKAVMQGKRKYANKGV